MLICQFLNKKFYVTEAIVISLKLAVDACPEQSHVWKKKKKKASAGTFVVTFAVHVYYTFFCIHLSELSR